MTALPIDSARVAAAAKLLATARREGQPIERLPDAAAPRHLAEALAMQDALAQRLAVPTVGWKIGATGRDLQAKIGLEHPFYGRVFSDTVHASGIALPAGSGNNILEAELAVRLAGERALMRSDHTRDSIADAVEAVMPCIEINRPSYRSPFAMRGLDVIADNGSNAGLVLGPALADWRTRDLAAITVVFRLNGEERARGTAAAVMGHPFAALAWFANDRAARGAPLLPGEIVATGSMMGFVAAKAGDVAEAVFTGIGPDLGTVKLRLG